MGTDRGVDLSRRAIKAARTDLEEALALLRPESGKGKGGGSAAPVLAQSGSVVQLNDDAEAMSGFWPAALGFQTSAGNGIRAVTTSYTNITDQVESVIELFNAALRNYDNAEGGEDRRQV
ncbi:hypothetical protein GCM10022419_002150 [Nonomuraea rosea]|uniref:PE domain-containing protein n=1 Tax=Nonomuraea rosea TaxID=638574 RepID=A0ABP6V289_9ACTN